MAIELAQRPRNGAITEKLTGADIVLRTVAAEGVTVMPVLPGGASLGLNDRLPAHDGIYSFRVNHESWGGFMAIGYARARLTQGVLEPGVTMATSGPGAANLVTPWLDAKMDSVAVVGLAGQVATTAPDGAFQAAPVVDLFRPITKYVEEVKSVGQVQEVIRQAFHAARSGRPGPTMVSLPKNVMIQKTLYQDMEPEPINKELSPEADLGLEELMGVIDRAQRPIIGIGHGVLISGAQREVIKLAEITGIPVVSTLHGLSAFPPDHPLYLGFGGMHGSSGANLEFTNADLFLGIGMRFDDRFVGSKRGAFAPNAIIAQIDIDPSARNEHINPHIIIQADAGAGVRKLLRGVAPNQHEDWLRTLYEHGSREYELVRKPLLSGTSEFIQTPEVMAGLSKITDGKALVVTDVGRHQMFASMYYKDPSYFISSGGLGTMGSGIPMAIGAALALPDIKVIAFIGDGGARMSWMELETLARLGVNVGVGLIDDNSLGMVRNWQENFYGGNYAHTDLPMLDFIGIANKLGIPGELVTQRGDLQRVMKRLASKGPFVAQILVDRDTRVFPMVVPGEAPGAVRLN